MTFAISVICSHSIPYRIGVSTEPANGVVNVTQKIISDGLALLGSARGPKSQGIVNRVQTFGIDSEVQIGKGSAQPLIASGLLVEVKESADEVSAGTIAVFVTY